MVGEERGQLQRLTVVVERRNEFDYQVEVVNPCHSARDLITCFLFIISKSSMSQRSQPQHTHSPRHELDFVSFMSLDLDFGSV